METLAQNTEAILSRFNYYKKLSLESKEEFAARVQKFSKAKEFEGREGLVVTEEMKVLISAAAIQLTFGLGSYKLKHFNKLLIYPDKFYSPFSKSKNVGEVNTKGILVFSWQAIKDGFKDEYDSKNVALHEFAHALNLSDEMGITTFFTPDVDPVFSYYYDKWYAVVRKFLNNPASDERKFFRKYAGKNLHEFFAVATEYFFEKPEEYQQILPELYIHHCCLLGQNPLNADFKLSKYDALPDKSFPFSSVTFEPKKSKLTKAFNWFALVICSFFLLISFDLGLWNTFFCGTAFLVAFYTMKRRILFIVSGGKLILKHKAIIPYETNTFLLRSILSVDFYKSGKNNSFLKIVIYRNRGIHFEHFRVYYDIDSLNPLLKHLFEEYDIVVKNEGRIFIPH